MGDPSEFFVSSTVVGITVLFSAVLPVRLANYRYSKFPYLLSTPAKCATGPTSRYVINAFTFSVGFHLLTQCKLFRLIVVIQSE
jgi:hypothetical protein